VLPSTTTIYEGDGSSMGEVKGFEQEESNLCQDPSSPFTNVHGFKLASCFLEGKVPKSRINEFFSSGHADAPVAGYSSMHTVENHLRALDSHSAYLQLYEGQVDDCKLTVMGVPYREVNSKVATVPKLKVEDKDRVINSRSIKTVKLNIVKLKASRNKFS